MADKNDNGLLCFTNCLLLSDEGVLKSGDLWIDAARGVVLDSQRTFYLRKERPRPESVIDLGGNILAPGLIDAQINGAYGFDFSEYDGDDEKYLAGLDMVARRIVETGVTSLLPTIITQESSLYPHLLELLRPRTPAAPTLGASLLGWHAEGPFLTPDKRGAHAEPLLQPSLSNGLASMEAVYGPRALAHAEDWALANSSPTSSSVPGVRMVTLAPELPGALEALRKLVRSRGVRVSIGHSVASADTAARAVRRGARMVTHLFNAMPQLHHRDPGIIGLLGASPASLVPAPTFGHGAKPSEGGSELLSPVEATGFSGQEALAQEKGAPTAPATAPNMTPVSEALAERMTPPETPIFAPTSQATIPPKVSLSTSTAPEDEEVDDQKSISDARPFYGLIVDGVHSHPNSVRLAYTAHKDGCVLVTDALMLLDPSLPDGVYPWRSNQRVIKSGARLYLENTPYPGTLAGSVVALDACLRNFNKFTGCGLGEALRCATLNPARALGVEGRKGTLRPGADADLCVMDNEGKVLSTWVRGKKVWEREEVEAKQ